MASQGDQKGIDLMTLAPQQLMTLKEQLEGQIEQFSVNFNDLQVTWKSGRTEAASEREREREF